MMVMPVSFNTSVVLPKKATPAVRFGDDPTRVQTGVKGVDILVEKDSDVPPHILERLTAQINRLPVEVQEKLQRLGQRYTLFALGNRNKNSDH